MEQQSLPPGRKCGLSAEKYEDILKFIFLPLFLYPFLSRSLALSISLALSLFAIPPVWEYFSSFVCAFWAFIPRLYNAWSFSQQS